MVLLCPPLKCATSVSFLELNCQPTTIKYSRHTVTYFITCEVCGYCQNSKDQPIAAVFAPPVICFCESSLQESEIWTRLFCGFCLISTHLLVHQQMTAHWGWPTFGVYLGEVTKEEVVPCSLMYRNVRWNDNVYMTVYAQYYLYSSITYSHHHRWCKILLLNRLYNGTAGHILCSFNSSSINLSELYWVSKQSTQPQSSAFFPSVKRS